MVLTSECVKKLIYLSVESVRLLSYSIQIIAIVFVIVRFVSFVSVISNHPSQVLHSLGYQCTQLLISLAYMIYAHSIRNFFQFLTLGHNSCRDPWPRMTHCLFTFCLCCLLDLFPEQISGLFVFSS